MSSVTLNGKRVVSGSITIPHYGSWVSDLKLADNDEASGRAEIAIEDASFIGHVYRSSVLNDGSREVRCVAGAGGWRQELPAKAYSHVIGVKMSSVLKDAARECGEMIEVAGDKIIGKSYVRESAPAERALHILTNTNWWIDNSGVTQTKTRTTGLIATPFTVVKEDGARGMFEIAAEKLADWLPGRTFNAPSIVGTQTISSVSINIESDKIRMVVLVAGDAIERLRSDMRALIRQEIASLSYLGLWEYTIAGTSQPIPGGQVFIDAISNDSRMPNVTNCTMMPGILGETVTPRIGSKCNIAFVGGSPTKPICVAVHGGALEHVATIESVSLLLYNSLVALMAAAGGGPLVAAVLQPLLGSAILAALGAQAVPAPPGTPAQIAAAAAQIAGFATGVAPATTSAFFTAAIAALDIGKTSNSSGLFPSIGCPSPPEF